MVQFNALKNDIENRRIRNVIMASGLTINVYEPSAIDIDTILDLQERWVDPDNIELRDISGVDIVRELFPLVSDLEGIDELSDEEIKDIVENPSIAYIQLQIEIETLLTEVYKTHVLSGRKRLLDMDYDFEAEKLNEETFNRAISLEAKKSGTNTIVAKIDKMAKEIEVRATEENEKAAENRVIQLNKVKEETEVKIDKVKEYNLKLAEYQKNFTKQNNEDE